MASTGSVGGTVRNVLVFGTVAFLLFMAILVIRSIFFLSADITDDGVGDAGNTPSGPVAAAPIEGAPIEGAAIDTTGIRCGRPADRSDPSFRIDAAPELAAEEIIVAVELVSADGSRHPRTVVVPIAEPGQGRQVIVPDSGDTALYQACVVTVIQQDRRVIITGR